MPQKFIQEKFPGTKMMLTFACPDGDAYDQKVIPKLKDVYPFVHDIIKKYHKLIHTHYVPLCYIYPYEKDVYYIDSSDDGLTVKSGYDFINNSWIYTDFGENKKDLRIKSENCIKCRFNKKCMGVLNLYAQLYNDIDLNDDLKPVYSLDDQLMILKNKMPLVTEDNSYDNRRLNIKELNQNPGYFILRIGFSCKAKCIHCFIENKRIIKDLTLEELKKTINTIPKGSIVTVTGGEPTDRSDLIEILKYLKENNYIVNLETNGIKFHNMEYLKTVSKYTDLFFVPIHSSNPEIFDKTTGVEGSFENVIKGLENMMYTDIYHLTISVFNQLNYKRMEETFDMIQEKFPGQLMSLTFPHPVGAAHTKEIVPRYSEVRDVVQNILKKHAPKMFVHYIPKCFTYPYHDIVIDIGSTDRTATDFIDNSWRQVQYSSRDDAKIKCESCKQCVFNEECPGIWKEYAELYPDIEKDLIPIKKNLVVDPLKIRFPNIKKETIDRALSQNKNIPKEEILSDLVHFVLRVKYSCDNSCVHCFVEDRKIVEDLSLEKIKSIIDSIDTKAITITGGEPTTRKDLFEIMEYAKNKNLLVDLQTNGNKLGDIEYFNKIKPVLDTVLLPVHSSDKAIFEKITGQKDTFEKVVKAFKNLVDSNIFVVTQTVINKLNYKHLVETCDMIQEISPGNTMLITFPCALGAAISTDIVPKYSEIEEYLQKVLKKYGYLIQTHYIPQCYLYPYQTIVRNIDFTDDGSMFKPGIDFTKKDWENVDYGKYDENTRIKEKNCKYCKFNNSCIGVLKIYNDLYDLDLKPILHN